MKKAWVIVFFAILASTVLIVAEEFPNYSDKYVNDFAGMLNQNEISILRSLLYSVDQNTTAEVSVVIVNTTSPYTAQEYATKLFTQWKIGKADKDNGLLILYAVTEKKIWVSTGYGLEGILPDSKIGRILDDYYVPLKDKNKTTEGIIAATQQLANVIEENKAEVISGQAGGNKAGTSAVWIFAAFFILIFVMIFLMKLKKNKNIKINKAAKKPTVFAIIINIAFWITLVLIGIIGFNIILIILLIIFFILRIILSPITGGRSTGFWGLGGGGFGGGGFGGGGFGGGGGGGGGAGR